MKRTCFRTAVVTLLVALCLLMSITGCGHDSPAAGDGTLQGQINAAPAGGSVTLNPSYTGTGITISKPLSVNGSGIRNLSITVNANVANDVTLTNFPNASLSVSNSGSGNGAHSVIATRSAFAARDAGGGNGEGSKPKELGDDNPKLRLERSTFARISTGEDVTIILDKDDDKVEVDELEIMNGVDEFVLIGNDDENDPDTIKSRIEKLSVEAGVGEIDLIGARFDDLDFTGDFTAKVDFYYEKDTEQAAADFKARLAEAAAQAEAMDVFNVRNGEGIYSVTVPKASIEAAQAIYPGDYGTRGSIFIMLLTDEQRDAFIDSIPDNPDNNLYVSPKGDTGWTWATKEKPYFDVGYTGTYLFTTTDEQLHTVAGDVASLYIVADEYYEYFDNYRTYSPDALCSQVTGDNITIWLDVSKLRKSDLNTCAYKADGYTDEYYCTPNKLTEIDLAGYKPYIVVDVVTYTELASPTGYYEEVEQAKEEAKSFFGNGLLNETQIMAPISKGNNGAGIGLKCVYMFPMETADSYPSEAATWETIACPPEPQNN